MRLSLDIIREYGFEETTSKPDWDDVQVEFELPNGLRLHCLTVCNNEPCSVDCLEGLDGYVYIETKEELDEILDQDIEDYLNKIASENKDFDIDEYL